MATLDFAFLQDLYPPENAGIIKTLSETTPYQGLIWHVGASKDAAPSFQTAPIREVIVPARKKRIKATFFTDLETHRGETALAIAEMQCEGLMWDDIGRALRNSHSRDEALDLSLWCFADMIICTAETRPEEPERDPYSFHDDGFISAIAMLRHQHLLPLVLLEGPASSNHAALRALERLEAARELIWERGIGGVGPKPDLPDVDVVRAAEPINL